MGEWFVVGMGICIELFFLGSIKTWRVEFFFILFVYIFVGEVIDR